nr:putative reverse transcriptase domain-containing protein [Tanacetum cinerariifolium]
MRQRRCIELFSDYDCDIRYHPGKANMVVDALSRKERLKPKRVKAMNMILRSSIKDKILSGQKEAVDEFARLKKVNALGNRNSFRHEYGLSPSDRWSDMRRALFEALYGRKCRSPIMWVEVEEGQLIGPELVQETTEKISQIKDRLKVTCDRQKKPVEILEKEFKKLKRIAIVKVQWNSKRAQESWEGVGSFWREKQLTTVGG